VGLKTVRVPPGIEPLFAQAEEIVSRYFRAMSLDAEHGTIEVFGERYVLVRAASLSVEFFSLVYDLYGPGRESDAEDFARNILFDLAHAIGKSDARDFHAKMGLSDPIARLSAGPVHFSHTGWAFVEIAPESNPVNSSDFQLLYDHPYAFEADAWLRAGKTRTFPVCIMNAGYSSGWCEESFSMDLVASEILCRAKGDEACRFVMAPPDRIEEHVARYLQKERAGAGRGHTIPDFFARKRIEEELRRARDELEVRVTQRTEELLRANERLRQEIAEREAMEKRLRQSHKLEALGRLTGGIAHDFNNLIGIVIGHGSILEKKIPADDPLRIHLTEITNAGMRAAGLARQLLAFGRAQVPRRQVLDLNSIVTDLGNMLQRVIGEDIELLPSMCETPCLIEADRSQIEQVVLNLVVNARDAMPKGGKVSVSTWQATAPVETTIDVPPGSYVVLTVRDEGVGMDEETISKIFDPFFTTKEDGGTGLGLSTVYGIVRQGGGTVRVESKPGKGSRFDVYWPRVDATSYRHASSAPRIPVARKAHGVILLVEDQASFRAMVAEVLTDLGYRVLVADGPDAALAIARSEGQTLDLLLTDVVMPRMSGRELAEELVTTLPALRVLYMSGYADDAVLRDGLKPEGARFLQKPFTTAVLEKALRELMEA
jgi:two-component system, cell cycle sensor histidine kinase and response regulator CckA